jgi:hypothetical protein
LVRARAAPSSPAGGGAKHKTKQRVCPLPAPLVQPLRAHCALRSLTAFGAFGGLGGARLAHLRRPGLLRPALRQLLVPLLQAIHHVCKRVVAQQRRHLREGDNRAVKEGQSQSQHRHLRAAAQGAGCCQFRGDRAGSGGIAEPTACGVRWPSARARLCFRTALLSLPSSHCPPLTALLSLPSSHCPPLTASLSHLSHLVNLLLTLYEAQPVLQEAPR